LKSGLKPDKALAELTAKPLSLDESLRSFHAAWKAASGAGIELNARTGRG
jgi:hypothetical protein